LVATHLKRSQDLVTSVATDSQKKRADADGSSAAPTQEDVGKEPTKDDLAEGVPARFLVRFESRLLARRKRFTDFNRFVQFATGPLTELVLMVSILSTANEASKLTGFR